MIKDGRGHYNFIQVRPENNYTKFLRIWRQNSLQPWWSTAVNSGALPMPLLLSCYLCYCFCVFFSVVLLVSCVCSLVL